MAKWTSLLKRVLPRRWAAALALWRRLPEDGVDLPSGQLADLLRHARASGIDNLLREKHAISRPLMLHIPTADHFVSPEVQQVMHEGLDDHPKVALHDYPGLDHGFAAEMGQRRNEEGATLADGRTEAFFAEHLA